MLKKVSLRLIKTIRFILIEKSINILSGIFPRSKKIWVIGSKDGFTDNSKYFYIQNSIYLKENYGVSLVWISNSKKINEKISKLNIGKSYYKNSIPGIFYLLRAKLYISSYTLGEDLSYPLSRGCLSLYLWHGVGIKRMRYTDDNPGTKLFLKNKFLKSTHPSLVTDPDFFLAPTEFTGKYFSQCFNLKGENIITAQYPRCMLMNISENEVFKHILQYEDQSILDFIIKNKKKKKIIYMPTWRPNQKDFLEKKFFDWGKLNEKLNERNSIFILKVHPLCKVPNLDNFHNIIVLGKDIDVYTLLPFIDLLITDYSSVYYDYLQKENGNILLFPFDAEDYIIKNNSFYYEYDKYMPGEKITTFEELIKNINFDDSKEYQKIKNILEYDFLKTPKNKDLLVRQIINRVENY